jgi:hypothetical protein
MNKAILTSLLVAAAVPAATAGAAPTTPAGTLISCKAVSVRDTHGGFIKANTNLSPIRHGKVRTLDPATGRVAQTRFTARSGRWLTAQDGTRYAVANQFITRNGGSHGALLITAPALAGHRVPCSPKGLVGAFTADTASYASDGDLSWSGYTEQVGSPYNVSSRPLENYATRDIYTSSPTSPDGAPRCPHPNTALGNYCYTFTGAGMNDMNGQERYSPAHGATYIDNPYHRHYIWYLGSLVAAAKRPNTKPNGTLIPNTPIVWRTVNRNANIAN